MNQRGKKPGSKLGVNMSFSDLVQCIVQRDANEAEQKLEKPETERSNAKASQAPKEIGRWHFTCRPYAAPTLLVRDNDTHIPEVACQNSYAERDPPA